MGGAELTANLLKRELENFGFEIKVLTTEFNNFDDSIIPIGFKIPIPDEFFFLGNRLLDKMLEKKIQEGLKKYNFLPDIIHVQQYFSLPASANVAKRLNIPLLVTIRVPLPTYLHHPYNFLIKFIGTQLIKGRNNLWINVLKEKCDHIIAVSNFIKNRLVKLGIIENKIDTIYEFHTKFDNTAFPLKKIENSIKNNKIIIYCPCRLQESKGIHILIKALKKIVTIDKNIILVITGEGPYEKNLKNLCKNLKLEKYVKFLGLVPFKIVEKLYLSSDIICMPSIWPEPLSRVVFEAMFYGKPIIISNVGGMPEAVKDNVTGLIVEPNNPEDLATALKNLIKNKKLRESMGKAAKNYAVQDFNVKRTVEEHVRIYQKLLEKRIRITNLK